MIILKFTMNDRESKIENKRLENTNKALGELQAKNETLIASLYSLNDELNFEKKV